ncbi:HAMP domain-containing histidine kinase [Acidobacteria bacterium AB60]|nr:HAMP domain-containing histidine kinase [Acidobacteria bacterium AB60]
MTGSMRARVVALVLSAQLLAAAIAVGLTILYVHRALWSSFDSEIQARMIAVLALVDESPTTPGGATFDTEQASIPGGDLFYVEDARGTPVAGSSSWISSLDRARAGGKYWKFDRGSVPYRGKTLMRAAILDQENHQIPQIRVNIFYAMPADRTMAQISSATRIIVLVALVSLLLSAGATWIAVTRGMRPLTEFARRADQIEPDGSRPQQPIEEVHSAELIPLARALHRLVDRIQAAFQRERRFLSDAAHELKTAVAIQKSTLQLLEQGTLTEREYREGIARALEDTGRTERLVADMLLLSAIEHAQRSETPDRILPTASLNDTLLAAIDRLESVARMKSIGLEFQQAPNVRVPARDTELTQLWVNLIENAIQHSPSGSAVVIATETNGSSKCRVRVEDRGSGIPSMDIPHVFERFYRSDASRSRLTGGSGLGLSIAKAVVEKNHGTIALQSQPGKGTTVLVELPAHPLSEG